MYSIKLLANWQLITQTIDSGYVCGSVTSVHYPVSKLSQSWRPIRIHVNMTVLTFIMVTSNCMILQHIMLKRLKSLVMMIIIIITILSCVSSTQLIDLNTQQLL